MRAHDVERTGLGRDDCRLVERAEHQWSPAAWVTRGQHRGPHGDHETVRALHSLQCIGELVRGDLGRRHGQPMDEYFGIHRRAEDRAALLEREAQLGGVRDVAVVRERNVPPPKSRQRGLRVLDRGRSGCAIAGVADRDVTRDDSSAFTQSVGDESERPIRVGLPFVIDDNEAGRFLSAMLQRIQAESRELDGVRMSVNTNNAAHEMSVR